jgi:hypothetical protein
MSNQCASCQNTYWIDSSEICPRCAGGCFDRYNNGPCLLCKGAGKKEIRIPCPLCNVNGDKPDRRKIIR